MSFLQNRELVDALTSLPERQLVEVIALALEAREAQVGRPEWQSAKLVLAEVHRFNEASATPSPWALIVSNSAGHIGQFPVRSGRQFPPVLHQTTASLSHSTQLRNGSLHDDQLAEKSLIDRPSDFLESLALPKCERTRIR